MLDPIKHMRGYNFAGESDFSSTPTVPENSSFVSGR